MIREASIIASTLLIAITATASFYAATQTPQFREVLFFEQLWGSSSSGGVAMALPWTAVGVAPPDSDLQPYFKPLPRSFVLSREWYSASSYVDQGESLWTFLRSGEVIRFGFNSSEPVYFDLVSDQSGVRQMHIEAAYSYSGTLRIQRSGLYFFDFSVDESVHRSVYATVSFRCSEAANKEAVNALHAVSFNTTAVQVNATREESPSIAPCGESPPDAINTSTQLYGLVALVILAIAAFSTYLIHLHQHRAETDFKH